MQTGTSYYYETRNSKVEEIRKWAVDNGYITENVIQSNESSKEVKIQPPTTAAPEKTGSKRSNQSTNEDSTQKRVRSNTKGSTSSSTK